MYRQPRKRVLIIQSQIKQYRAPFYEELYKRLYEQGVELRVAYSDPTELEARKNDTVDLPLEYGRKTKAHWFFKGKLLYQSIWNETRLADLIVIEQANKYVVNHLLVLASALGLKKVAFWGHGWDHGPKANLVSGWIKDCTVNLVDWWFAYTAGTAHHLAQKGVSIARITSVENSIDTTILREQLASISDSELLQLRTNLGISERSKVGLFCSGITPGRMAEFFTQTVSEIKKKCPDFEVLAIGSGPEQKYFEQAAIQYPWFHYLGPRFGREKAAYFALSDIFLMPGVVGLAILDAFAAGIPIVTTDVPIHSPEIEYLEPGRNGVITECDVQSYAIAVARLLDDPAALKRLQAGALVSAQKYTIQAMADNFCQGIIQCLKLDSRRTSASILQAGEQA